MLLIDDVLLQLRRGVRIGDHVVMSIAHRVVGAVFSRVVVSYFVVGAAVGRITVLSTLKASIKGTVGQIEVNRRLIYRHLSDAKNGKISDL